MILPAESVGIQTGLQFADGLGPLQAFLNVDEAAVGTCEMTCVSLVLIKISCPSLILPFVKPVVALTFSTLNL